MGTDGHDRIGASRLVRLTRLGTRVAQTAVPALEQAVRRAGGGLGGLRRHAGEVASARRDRSESPRAGGAGSRPRGLALRGTVWTGDSSEPFDGVVVLDGAGTVLRCAPAASVDLPPDLPTIGGPGSWVGPGITDAHVHLAFGDIDGSLAAGLVGIRDLGAPLWQTRGWRTGHASVPPHRPFVAVAGPMLTATGGYPSRSWGPDGFGYFIDSPADARAAVHWLATEGVDVIKLALEPARGWPVLDPMTVRAVVDTAHGAGLAVVAHAVRAGMVLRAVDAGVDELAHVPIERLDDGLIARLADARIAVVSTLQTWFSEGVGRDAAANAAALVAAGVELRYGTDLGNTGTRPGVDPRELDRLADAGLGRLGALRAATLCSGRSPGLRNRPGILRVGAPAHLVVLPADPLREPGAWRTPTAVVSGGRVERPRFA